MAESVRPAAGIKGGGRNRYVSKGGIEEWPDLSKDEVAERIAESTTYTSS